MNREVFGLRYDFVFRHGHSMMLHRDDGLAASELSALQLRMMESNKIPRLLPLDVQEVDFRISLLYDLASKRMLAHVIKVEGLSRQQYCKMLYSILCALDDSKNYMLTETQYILKDQFIFIGNDWSDVYLTYVPLERVAEEISLKTQMVQLAEQLAQKLNEEERIGIDNWLDAGADDLNLKDAKEKLIHLMENSSTIGIEQQELLAPSRAEAHKEPAFAEQHHGISSNTSVQATHTRTNLSSSSDIPSVPDPDDPGTDVSRLNGLPKPVWMTRANELPGPKSALADAHLSQMKASDQAAGKGSVSGNGTGNGNGTGTGFGISNGNNMLAGTSKELRSQASSASFLIVTQRTKLIVTAAAMLLAAFLWQHYLSAPSEALLRVVSGASLLLADACFMISYVGLPLFWRKNEQERELKAKAPASCEEAHHADVSGLEGSAGPLPTDMKQYYQNLHMRTMLLSASKPNQTVFLGEQQHAAVFQKPSEPVIEVSKEGIVERVAIKGNSLTIGRGETEVDYMADDVGVSRLHAEIVKAEEGYAVKDLGSMNGTYLNDQLLVPYQAYPLKEGDTIRIVRTEFAFRMN